MRLQHRTLLITSAAVAAMVGALWFAGARAITSSFERLEDEAVRATAKRAKSVVVNAHQELSLRASDWGGWDECYNFIQGKNPGFRDEFLQPDPVRRLGASMIFFLDTKGTLTHSFAMSRDLQPVPFSSALASRDWSDISLATAEPLGTTRSGIVLTTAGPLILGAAQVLHTDSSGPCLGTLVLARWVDEHEASTLAEAVHLPVRFDVSHAAGKEEAPERTRIVDDAAIAGAFEIPMLSGDAALVGELTIPRDIASEGRHAVAMVRDCLIVAGVGFGWLVYFMIGRLVLRRVSRLAEGASAIAATRDLSKRFELGCHSGPGGGPTRECRIWGRDEINHLSGDMNLMLDQLQAMDQEVRSAKSRAELASEAKTRFLASMSHEIRTPLNGIIGFADMLRRNAETDEAERAEWVGIIHGSATHLLGMLNDVLDYSKLDAGSMRLEVLECDVRTLVWEVRALMSSKASDKGLTLGVEIDPETPETIRTDPTRLRQVLVNLTSNAVKFTEAGGVRIDIGPGHSTRTMRFRVVDTGIGMSPGQVGQLFRPFAQADDSISRRFGGTGLGLAICKTLAGMLGGDISVQSTPGKGSAFTLEVACDLKPGESLEHAGTTGAESASARDWESTKPLSGKTILVVDDTLANRKLFQLTLERAGARVTLAEDGAKGIQAALGGAGPHDVILMDMQMPVHDGMTATRTLRERGIKAPIVALTAHASGVGRAQAMEAGCVGYLCKPIEAGRLVHAVVEFAEGRGVDAAGGIDAPITRVEIESSGDPLAELRAIDDPKVREIAEDWLTTVPDRLEKMKAALAANDAAELARLAHAVRGTAGTLELNAFMGPAGDLEDLAIAERLSECAGQIREMQRLLDAVTEPQPASPPKQEPAGSHLLGEESRELAKKIRPRHVIYRGS